jgi:ATP-dependent helicase IRC3
MQIELRPYQNHCIEAIKKQIKFNQHRLIVSLPTGAGKTVIFSHFIGQENKKTLVLAHREELLEQAKSKIESITNIPVGIVNQRSKDFGKQVVIASIQSAYRNTNLQELIKQHFELCIYDECHRAAAMGSRLVLKELGFGPGTKKILIGFTATPFRNDKRRGLKEVFDIPAYECNIRKLIDDGYLVKPIGYIIRNNLDLSSVATEGDDWEEKSLSSFMDTDEMLEAVVDTWQEKASGRQTICFGINVKHSQHLADTFNARNITAVLIHGGMDPDLRRQYLDEYSKGTIQILCNAQVLVEGIDLPATSCIILSPTKSDLKAQQAFGRGLRLAAWIQKKDCIFLTFDDREHKIRTITSLVNDAELGAHAGDGIREGKKWAIPEGLNEKLSTILREYDPLGSSFIWQQIDGAYVMIGNQDRRLQIEPQENGMWEVNFWRGQDDFISVAEGVDFEFAFGLAEAAARRNERWFVLGDKDAAWRKEPISEKQISLFKAYKYTAGIKDLTKGQASVLIDSLRKGS